MIRLIMKRAASLLLTGLLVLVLSLPAAAGTIRLKILPGTSYEDGQCRVSVRLSNEGTETALNIQLEADLAGRTARSKALPQLEPGQGGRCRINLGEAPALPGEYTAVLRVHYTDANAYPFSAVSRVPLVSRAAPDAPEDLITAQLSSCRLKKSGLLRLNLSSSTSMPVEVTARIVLPSELDCSQPERTVTVPANASVEIPFEIQDRWARPSSTYPVFVVVDYRHQELHRSAAAHGRVTVPPLWRPRLPGRFTGLVLFLILTMVFVSRQSRPVAQGPKTSNTQVPKYPNTPTRPVAQSPSRPLVFPFTILIILFLYTAFHVPGAGVFKDTLTTGGDTPAHHVLASHLKTQLFEHGRIVSWSHDWWGGFPMFQFYFCLPYVLIALLNCVLPFNIAFKIISVLGILLLPLCLWGAARRISLPKPTPTILALAAIPFLFDQTHSMWGLNITSTLAGMISASLSLPLMILFIASITRDTDEGVFRLRTVFLLAGVIAGHFFTALLAGLSVLILPFLWPRAGFRKALKVFGLECGLAFLLMAWWIVPLVAKTEYSMGFGSNWDRPLHPVSITGWIIAVLAIPGIVLGCLKRNRFVAVMICMLAGSAFLFFFGYALSPVFVNVRLWPFFHFSLAVLAAVGLGLLLEKLKSPAIAVTALLILVLAYGTGQAGRIQSWARWNYSGLESKMGWSTFRQLVTDRLQDTPGRLANDLHPQNHAAFGSTRAFESVPHMIGKPILEGGIVNSAAGSLFGYFIQGETSRSSAGLPNLVTAATFNITNATRHLELFNVKHFIARWPGTQTALAESPDWRLLDQAENWQLYELLSHDGSLVFIPSAQPAQVRVAPPPEDTREGGYGWKMAGLQWIYTIGAIDQPFIILRPGEDPEPRCTAPLTQESYHELLSGIRAGTASLPAPTLIDGPAHAITRESVTDNAIRFTTSAPGLPHIIKCNYYPNWKVRGADKVYRVTPGFMLIYPTESEVELYYGYTLSDNVGRVLALLGYLFVGAIVAVRYRAARQAGSTQKGRTG